MLEEKPEYLRRYVEQLANEALEKSEPSAWFEVLYASAKGDAAQVPWAKLTPHPYLQDWLHTHQLSGEGKTALVIGCGLGDDAEALAQQGFAVTAFDISPTAIAWCQQRFPHSTVNYVVADLLAIPAQWDSGFDFVFECRNIQALPLTVRPAVISAVASMVAVGGRLLMITRFQETEAAPSGPPWPLSDSELLQLANWGLQPVERIEFFESEQIDVKQLRIEYQKRNPDS